MRTASKLVYSKENYYTENGEEYKIKTTVSLGDDCHNNICEWSITADIRWKNEYGIYKEYMCGCCHDEIIRHCPELAKFIPMHVCNHYGAPMYPVENGIYHTKNSDKSVVIEYLRISDKEYSKLSEAVDDKMYFKYLLFNLGIVDRWKRESDELIAELENLCGKKWVNPYKPEKERFTLTLTDEERSLIEERIEAGYYSTENIEKRREEAHKAKMAEKRAKICEQYDKEIRKAEVGKKVMLCVLDYGLNVDNVIYYNHNNTLRFNWVDYGEKITKEEFDDFVNNVDRSQLLDKNGLNDKMDVFINRLFNENNHIRYLKDIGYHKIGSIFKYNTGMEKIELEVIEIDDSSCDECVFNNRGYYCMYSCCCNIDREDNTDVIYKEVKRS